MSNSGGSTLKTFSDVFAGNVAVPYAAFNLRDNYYREMARILFHSAIPERVDCYRRMKKVLEIGAGIGISSLVFAELLNEHFQELHLLEPNEQMRALCGLNFLGDPRVHIHAGFAADLEKFPSQEFYGVFASQMVHLLHPSMENSQLLDVAKKVRGVMVEGGVFAFDLGPSNFQFESPISDHRSGVVNRGEIMTELSHPLYQRAHAIMCDLVNRELGTGHNVTSLWPQSSAVMTREYLTETLLAAGFFSVRFEENVSPYLGVSRIMNFIRNGWAVFFRWVKHNEISQARQFELIELMVGQLFVELQTDKKLSESLAQHPTVAVVALS